MLSIIDIVLLLLWKFMWIIWWVLFMIIIVIIIPSKLISLIDKREKRIKRELERWIIRKHKFGENKVWDKNVIIEYEPPKWLSPIEVWYLYDMDVGKADIICLIYKWAVKWIVSLSYESNLLKVTKKGSITDKTIPWYERNFRFNLFENSDTVKITEEVVNENLWYLRNAVKEYCMYKDWVDWDVLHFSFEDMCMTIIPFVKPKKKISYIPFGRIILFLFWIAIMIVWWVYFVSHIMSSIWDGFLMRDLFITLGLCLGWLWWSALSIPVLMDTGDKHVMNLTKKWEELVSQIYWYKRFLEACEKRQLNELMEKDSLYMNKMIPYAIALWLGEVVLKKIPSDLLDDDRLLDILHMEKII